MRILRYHDHRECKQQQYCQCRLCMRSNDDQERVYGGLGLCVSRSETTLDSRSIATTISTNKPMSKSSFGESSPHIQGMQGISQECKASHRSGQNPSQVILKIEILARALSFLFTLGALRYDITGFWNGW